MDVEPHRKALRRVEYPNHARYLTFSCYQRRPLMDEPDVRDAVADQVLLTRERLGFRVFAWVVMPEHVHLLIVPGECTTFPEILSAIKRPVATRVLRAWRSGEDQRLELATLPDGKHRFWQAHGGYDRNILDGHELAEKVGYIHANPVRRGLVQVPGDWDWSSARASAGLETRWPVIDGASGDMGWPRGGNRC
ncbi:MAG: transposase [Phycisphaerales bacterium]